MRRNRFLITAHQEGEVLEQPSRSRFLVDSKRRNGFGLSASKPGSSTAVCQQFSEEIVDGDLFVLDVLELFFDERLPSVSLNDALRQTASYAVDQANQLIPAADAVPRPANGSPSSTWLISDAVQTAFRKAQNKCIYQAVKKTVSQRLRVQYERDKNSAIPLADGQQFYTRGLNVNNLIVSQAGIDLIKRFEGFRTNVYNDIAGHCTIGYGTLIHQGNCNGSEPEEFRAGITEARATELLMQRINTAASAVNSRVTVSLNQNQFDALVSFVYNIGTGAFGRSTLLRKLNEGNYAEVSTELRRWIHANGRVVRGLVDRRNIEIELFNRTVSTSQSLTRAGACGCNDHNLSTPSRMQDVARGIRNNNPGNIEINDANHWEGKVPRSQNTDGRFEQFTSYGYGVRALIILLRNYITSTRNTLTKIFEAYAPPSENSTQNYIRFVAERIGKGPNEVVPLTKSNLKSISQAIARMENGVESISDAQFEEGWSLLSPEIASSISQSKYAHAYTDNPFFDIRTCSPDAAFHSTWRNIKTQIVAIARAEYAFWTRHNNSGRYSETDPHVTQRLQDYWGSVGVNPTVAQIRDTVWQQGIPGDASHPGHPWSAAFISWVMVQAGATPSFRTGQRHTIYAYAAKQNAESRNLDNPFWLCRADNALPEPGDLIVKNRRVNGTMGTITYDSLTSTGSSHSDIVTAVDYAAGTITVMGGNKTGNSVNTETFRLNTNGAIDTAHHPEVFGIIKLRTERCETCGTTAIV